MPRRTGQYDCIVVGGGPSGCIAASRLAEWGRRVLLLDDGRSDETLVEETIGADAVSLLKRHALTASVRAHGFHGTPRAGVVWGDGELRIERRPRDARGFKVRRALFDRDLRRFAEALGVEVVRDATVLEAWTDEVVVGGNGKRPERLRARCVVVAAGAAANVAPVEVMHRLPIMTAVTALVERPRSHRDAVVIEAVEDGWTRWLPLGDGRVAATLFADENETREVGAGQAFARARTGSSGPFADAPATELHLVSVDVRHQGVIEGVFLCGDAACTVDPLLGQGIEKAILSGESCAVAVNSCLEEPELFDRVLQYHDNTEYDLYIGHARRALQLYLQEVRFSDRPFWNGRHSAVEVEITSSALTLPPKLRVMEDVAEREGLRVRGKRLEPVRGWGRCDSNAVFERVVSVPVAPLIKLVRGTGSTDELLDLAGVAPVLYMHSRASVQRALTELVRLGIIGAANGGRSP